MWLGIKHCLRTSARTGLKFVLSVRAVVVICIMILYYCKMRHHRNEKDKYSPETLRNLQAAVDHQLVSTSPVFDWSPTFVLLVTYARSGSTWLGDITSRGTGTMYVYEPLHRVVVEGYYKKDIVCFNNNTCRLPRQITETHTFAVTTLLQIFACNISQLHPVSQELFFRHVRMPNSSSEITTCRNQFDPETKYEQYMECVCDASRHRVIKTIRISMSLVRSMLDLLPDLKVIHLVRDPRGITSSRLKGYGFQMTQQLVPHSQDLCKRLSEDLESDVVISRVFPEKLKLLYFETLAEKPLEIAECIYNFLNIKLTENIKRWIYTRSFANSTDGYFGTQRTNSTDTAYQWRRELDHKTIEIIDRECKDVNDELGFSSQIFPTQNLISNIQLCKKKRSDSSY